jgi:hypothetical protein
MNNPEKLATLGTQDIRQRQTKIKKKTKKTQKTKPMSNIDPTKNPSCNTSHPFPYLAIFFIKNI